MVKVSPCNNQFAFNLLAEVLKTDAGKNVFISPASVSIALTMAMNGARGETLKAIAEALGLPGDEPALQHVNRVYAKLLKRLVEGEPKPLHQMRGEGPSCGCEHSEGTPVPAAEKEDIELLIANSLWARQGIDFKPEFLADNRQHFNAEVQTLDFTDPQTLKAINDWCSRNTKGKITEILKEIGPDAIMYLVNAIYFYGPWTNKFDEALTEEKDFTLADGSTKKHPLMYQQGEYLYQKGANFQAVALPYGQDQGCSMYVLLPDQGTSLTELQKSLTADNWSHWQAQFRSTPGEVRIPRFKLDYGISLNQILQGMGMTPAFSSTSADFSGLVSPPAKPFISNVLHKTFVEVTEKGTEAAAVTAVEFSIECCVIQPPPFAMTVDRPFICLIQNNNTGTVLFAGAIVEPK